jgi:hypothetical protein
MANLPAELTAIATATAKRFGCEAVRWWQDPQNPSRLWIESTYKLSTGETIAVLLTATLPPKETD